MVTVVYLSVCLSAHFKNIIMGLLDFSFEKYASGNRLTCTSCPCVLLRVLNTLRCGERSKKRTVLVFLGRSHFECFTVTPIYAHVNCHVLCFQT